MIPLLSTDRVLIGVAVSYSVITFSGIADEIEYRSAIFTHSPEQEAVAKEVTAQVQEK
jgi:hypothetical protein